MAENKNVNPSLSIQATATIEAQDDGDSTMALGNDGGSRESNGEPRQESTLAKFTMTANTGAPMRLSGWKAPVILDMAGLTIPSQKAPVRFQHDPMYGVGHCEAIGVQSGKLIASGVISRGTPAALEIKQSAKNGFPWQASVGATADEVEFVRKGERAAVNGQEVEGPVNIARKSTLGEISFVDLGADPMTDALIATNRIAAAKDEDLDDNNDNIRRPKDDIEAMEQAIARTEKEQNRQKVIKALIDEALGKSGANVDKIRIIGRKAMDEGWDRKDTQLQLLRADRASVPDLWVRNDQPATQDVLEAALCLHMGCQEEFLLQRGERGGEFNANTLTDAHRHRKLGLHGTIRAAMEAMGIRPPHGQRELFEKVIEIQQGRTIRAEGFSTINLPGILGNVANKILLEAFTKVDATYDKIAQQSDYSNFHIHSIYRLEHLGDFSLVPGDGQIKHGALSQDFYTNQLNTYGQMLTITRQDIVNDDLNAFRSLTAQLARKARIAVEKALYSLVCESSPSFYTTSQGNLLATNSLGVIELAKAEAAQYSMTDQWGDPIYAISRFLLVPPQLKYLAESIYNSKAVMQLSSTDMVPTDNPYVNRFIPVSSPFLSNPNITGSSPTTWYLLADPLMLPSFEVAYLDGRRAPTIETSETVFNVLGLQMRAYWDFGTARIDYRGAVKSTA